MPGPGPLPISTPLELPPKRADISLRKDSNVTKRGAMGVKRDVNSQDAIGVKFSDSFGSFTQFSADSIYDFCQKIMYNWFPQNNFTTKDVSGNLTINGQSVGGVEFIVVGDQTIDMQTKVDEFFTTSKDTSSSFIFVKGNLTIDDLITLTPPTRKLFTTIYISGNLTFNGPDAKISMTQRGANHSGTGESGGYVAPVPIKVGPNTVIASSGADGANVNLTDGTAVAGTNGTTTQGALQTGGGGGGWNDYKIIT